MIPLLISLLASLAAFAGGTLALRFRDKLHIILGLSAGAVIGAALFDLIPEAIELGSSVYAVGQVTTFTAVGFLVYLILDRVFSFHSHGRNYIHDGDSVPCADEDLTEPHAHHEPGGTLAAASFCLHSLIDGVAIGLAFQASATVGVVIAVAVVAHRFSDGINTVGLILKHHGGDARAWGWLAAVALAPLVGTAATFTMSVSDAALAVTLAIFAGFFLYIGASDLIPEGHHSHAKGLTTAMTILGAILLYIIVHIAQI